MRYDNEKKTVYTELGELMTMAARHGSIRRGAGMYEKAKAESAIREKILNSNPKAFDNPTAVAYLRHGGYKYTVRAGAEIIIEEETKKLLMIKAVGGGYPDTETLDLWKMELCCLCAIFGYEYGALPQGEILLYSDTLRGGETITLNYKSDEINGFFFTLIERAHEFIKFEIERIEKRIPAAAALRFPYTKKRQGQADFMTEAFRTAKSSERLICEAPTGIGKTVSAIYPAVKALGASLCDKIFYFTPKTTTQYAALDTVKDINNNSPVLRSLILTAKDKHCIHSDGRGKVVSLRLCEGCARANGHFDRCADAVLHLLTNYISVTKEEIDKTAELFCVCPYELSLDYSEFADIIICDYNYLFDPNAFIQRYFSPDMGPFSPFASVKRNKFMFLIDEAHNLSERAKAMYSHTVRTKEIREVLAELGDTEKEKELSKILSGFEAALLRCRALCSENSSENDKGESCGYAIVNEAEDKIKTCCREAALKIDEIVKENIIKLKDKTADFYFSCRDFVKKSDYFSEKFRFLAQTVGDEVIYKLLCLDASDVLNEKMETGRAAVLFSATLSPVSYYAKLLGCDEAVTLVLPSPFPKENLSVTVFDSLSTRYVNRRESLLVLADIIKEAVSAKKGNYMVFFPSYHYMEELHGFFRTLYPDIQTLMQKRNMTEEERLDFIATFDINHPCTLVGFCVLGGIYAEGIDLVGERLIGSIVIGVGLPRVSLERNILKEYYDNNDEDGYTCAYLYPGMTRVLQAAGRVIRSENDRGIVILIDDRFAEPRYKKLFPLHWRQAKFVTDPHTMKRLLNKFWE